jgi:antitoxin (DNA-binding transcriptional repressor) of toxin-antitoxin stability system
MTVTADIGTSVLLDLVKQVQAGHEVLLIQGNKPVAKIVLTPVKDVPAERDFLIPGFSGHRALTPVVSQAELADDMFSR